VAGYTSLNSVAYYTLLEARNSGTDIGPNSQTLRIVNLFDCDQLTGARNVFLAGLKSYLRVVRQRFQQTRRVADLQQPWCVTLRDLPSSSGAYHGESQFDPTPCSPPANSALPYSATEFGTSPRRLSNSLPEYYDRAFRTPKFGGGVHPLLPVSAK
jgi:hypothetical protein